MGNKYRIRKTGEIIEIISYGGSTTRTDTLDYVSYIDSKGVEHEREHLNLYWDLEQVENPNTNDNFDRILRMNTEAERRQIAAMVMQGLLSNSEIIVQALTDKDKRDLARESVSIADALIAELNKKKDK